MTYKAKSIIKRVAVVAAAAVIGICLGYLVSSYEVRFMLAREYEGSYKGIEIYSCGDINRDIMDAHQSMLRSVPDELLKGCRRIYFTGSDIDIPVNDSGYGQALGLTQGGTVYVSTRTFGADVVVHELFHTYDAACGMLSSNDEDFIAAYDAEKDNIRIIAGHSSHYPSEFFAEAGAMYIISPFELSIRAPLAYEYFQSIFRE